MPYYKTTHFSIWNYIPNITLPPERHLMGFLETIPNDAIIVDIGAGGRRISDRILTVDKFVTDGTDICSDIHNLTFGNSSINCIICTGTFEHIENPWRAVSEFERVLKHGGLCYIGTPFMQGYHPDPSDYWRFTIEGLKVLFKGFRIIDEGVLQGSGSGLSWALMDFFKSFSDRKIVSEMLGVVSRVFFCWIKYFDLILRRNKNNRLFASGYYIICQKG